MSWMRRLAAENRARPHRNLAVMVGGDREVFDRVKPILDAIGDKVFYTSAIGAGSVAKLVHNMIGHGVRQAIAEGLTLGVKAGVDADALWECIRRGSLGRMNALHEGIPRTTFRDTYSRPVLPWHWRTKTSCWPRSLVETSTCPCPWPTWRSRSPFRR